MNRIISISILISLLVFGELLAQDDVIMLRRNDSGITFRYMPSVDKKQTVQTETGSYVRYLISGTDLLSKPGEPEIPVRTFVFAVPPGSQVEARVTGSFSQESNINLIPVASWDTSSEIPEPVYSPDDSLKNTNDWFPKQIFQLEKPAYMGDTKIARLHIFPVQFSPGKKLVRLYQTIEVQLSFTGGNMSVSPGSGESLDSSNQLVRKIVLNPEQAKKWIAQDNKRTLRKRKSFFAGSDFYKIPVETEGLYRITGKFLKDNGIDISMIQPRTIKIFNNGGTVLPQNITSARPDSLIENAIEVVDGADNSFDESDYILFYGRGVSGWKYSNRSYSHYINPYTFSNVYWLTFNDGKNGKRILPSTSPATVSKTVTTYEVREFVEDEIYNLHHSGVVWFGPQFDDQTRDHVVTLNIKNLVQTNRIGLRARIYSATGSYHQFQFFFDGEAIGSSNYYGSRLLTFTVDTSQTISGDAHSLEIKYSPSSQVSLAYLDWLEVSARAELKLVNNSLIFFSDPEDNAVAFQIGGVTEGGYKIYNITDFANVSAITDYSNSGGLLTFRTELSENLPKKFAVIGDDKIKDITSITKDENSDLRNTGNGADFIIITHNDFYNAAVSLKNLRESHDGLQTKVVKIEDVFDEFSAGLTDPAAIRDFLKYAYDFWASKPQYVLLFGDGDYDYKNLTSNIDSNWIPPHETDELNEIDSRTSDDWFTYVHGDDSVMDFSIGRLPVRTTEEAEFVVDKLVEYCTTPSSGFWKNLFTMVADDEMVEGGSGNETIHTYDAEDLVEKYVPNSFDLEKIYLMEYPIVLDASASWISKPGVTEDLINRINQGSLIINFIGHGNPHLWTHERILKDSRDENRIQNGSKYAFWITATCDFGRWDDPEAESFAEVLLKMQERGAVSMLASARLVYASSNAAFNKQYVKYLLGGTGELMRVGDAMRLAKQVTSNKINNEKFHILGDPTLKLAVPSLKVEVSELKPDSLKALSLIRVNGDILDQSGKLSDFNGRVHVKTFDSKRNVTYTTKAGSSLNYKLPGNPIFRGANSAENGRFEARFIVPKDISYGGQSGRISIYFEGDGVDGVGYRDDLIVDGTATDLIDNNGPKIHFEANDQPLVDFAVLNQDESISIFLEDDKSGINITGDVGHKIIAIPDENAIGQKDITHLFEYEQDSYLKGVIQLPMEMFPEFDLNSQTAELHNLTLKAWDNANNSSKEIIRFELVPAGELVMKDVLNYPNPFLDKTTFTFFLNAEARITIKIYTMAGRTIARIEDQPGAFGFNMIPWEGTDRDGDPIANGVYLYRISAKNESNSTEQIGKLIKMR